MSYNMNIHIHHHENHIGICFLETIVIFDRTFVYELEDATLDMGMN